MRARLLALALAAAVVATPRAGASADPLLNVGDGALQVQAENLEVDVTSGEAILTGNVSLTKGDLHVACPRIELKFDATPHVTWARGSGGVTADLRGVHAEGPEAELDLRKQVLDLRGGVRLERGTSGGSGGPPGSKDKAWLTAESARIDLATAKVTATQVKGSIPVPPKGQ
jgi:lipopolysaccharide export system protein LptA